VFAFSLLAHHVEAEDEGGQLDVEDLDAAQELQPEENAAERREAAEVSGEPRLGALRRRHANHHEHHERAREVVQVPKVRPVLPPQPELLHCVDLKGFPHQKVAVEDRDHGELGRRRPAQQRRALRDGVEVEAEQQKRGNQVHGDDGNGGGPVRELRVEDFRDQRGRHCALLQRARQLEHVGQQVRHLERHRRIHSKALAIETH
jgi:hypothetical protein